MGHDHDASPAADLAGQLHVAAGRSGVLPGLHVLVGELHERLSARWPQAVTADYPALAQPGAARV